MAHAHALAEYPRESCGVVVIVKGRERYWPCRNAATTPSEHFILQRDDHAAADDAGEITTIVHSHPGAPARPSDADKTGCEASELPWVIISVRKDGAQPFIADTFEFAPSGYVAPLVGRTFAHGVLDCWALCRDWYAREWGLVLPDPDRPDNWWNDGHSDLYTDNLAAAGFAPIGSVRDMQIGDMILMQIRSKNLVPNHASIYIGDGWMLHHPYKRLSTRDVYGGYWQECTRAIVRHRDAPAGN